ncbi:MAG: tRNA 2-thiouridine(34) synthase MnmA [Anaerovoracaceae bacterium]
MKKRIITKSMQTSNKEKVILGLSGGVDSTAAALLLQKQGYEVIAVFFDIQPLKKIDTDKTSRFSQSNPSNLLDNNENNNTNLIFNHNKKNIITNVMSESFSIENNEYYEAKKTAEKLGIKLVYWNEAENFENKMIKDYFCKEYENGRTPSPCIFCNPEFKFRILNEVAEKFQANKIATGHYARIEDGLIAIAANQKKDQSYMLYRLSETIRNKLLFPLSEIKSKEEVREIVAYMGHSNSKKKDSQEICFVDNDKNYSDLLLEKKVKIKTGNFIDKDSKVLGKHKGIIFYTVGQRKGLGITFGKPMYVSKINSITGDITLDEESGLFNDTLTIANCYFTETDSAVIPTKYLNLDDTNIELHGKIRYSAKPAKIKLINEINCEDTKQISSDKKQYQIIFEEKQKSISPGQSLVIYENDKVVGGGIIT